VVLPPNQDAVQVALRAAVGDVAPVIPGLPKAGKPFEDPDLKLARVDAVVAFDERVAQVVD
jgi:hypothetical protein